MNPPPLGEEKDEELVSKFVRYLFFCTKVGGGNEGIERERARLKSVEGSEPCQPMSFHCSDFRGGTSRDGYASLHSSLRESCHHFCQWIIYYIYI